MLGFDIVKLDRAAPRLTDGIVTLRPGEPRDAAAWIDLRERSKSHLTRWEPSWNSADMTVETVKARLRLQARERRTGASLPMFVFRNEDGALVGGATLSDIKFHAARSAQLGYWIGHEFARRGYGLAAARLLVSHAVGSLGLNRVEAACQPQNSPSHKLLTRLGFQREGFAREYLFINGVWRDHYLYALLAREVRALDNPWRRPRRGVEGERRQVDGGARIFEEETWIAPCKQMGRAKE